MNDVEIWFVATNCEVEIFDLLESKLTECERAEAARFRLEADRRRSIVGRGALRCLLPRYVEREVEIVRDARGKPRAAEGEIEFSVSHSGELVVIGFASSPVGVDVEQIRPLDRDARRVARSIFSPEELQRFDGSSNAVDEFFTIWTAKEAVVKATGEGMSTDLHSFTVSPSIEEFREVQGREGWSVRGLVTPRRGYRAAVATTAAGEPVLRTATYP